MLSTTIPTTSSSLLFAKTLRRPTTRNYKVTRNHDAVVVKVMASSAGDGGPNESMDDTMKSLDDLLPPPPKPKREFPDSFYDDDPSSSKPPPAKTSGGVSKEMRAKLLNESVGLGGVPGKAMPSNLFANIILFVLALVVVAYVGGIRP